MTKLKTILSIATFASTSSSFSQVTYTWDDGGNNNSWNKASNWVGGNIPDGTNHIAFFNGLQSGIGSSGTKVYVTNEGGDIGTIRNLYGLSFLTENSNEQWRIYGNQGETPNKNVKIRVHNQIAHNLVNGGAATIFCTLEIVNDITWSMNGGSLLLSQPLDGTGNINGVSGPQIDGLGGLSLRGAGNYSGTITTGQGTINILNSEVLRNAVVNLNDTTTNRLTYNADVNIGEIKGNGILTLNGALNVGYRNTDSTLSGLISGGGPFNKKGTGTLTLTADNTYTGLTKIDGGAIRLGNGGTTGSIAGNISVGSGKTLIYNRSDDSTFSNIGGGGKIEVAGSGNLTLLGDHTNLSLATASNGTLKITRDDSGPLSIIGRIISNSETHIIKGGNWLNTYGGLISGSGTVRWEGGQKESKFRLERDQTYTGVTEIERGTLFLGKNGTAGWIESSSVIGNGFLRFNRLDPKTFSGVISDAISVEKYSLGITTITANNTYTGTTNVVEGTLLVNGSISTGDVTVGGGATLGGNGTIGGEINSNGVISPGTSVGTLTVNNDVTLTRKLLTEIDGANADFLDVSGALDISSAILDIDILSGGVTENVYLIASYGSLSGPFSSVSDLPVGYAIDYAFNGNNIAIIETQQPVVSSITTGQATPTNANSIIYTVTFSEAVSGFDELDDLIITGGVTATGVTITNPSADSITYQITLNGISGNGIINLSVSPSGTTPVRDIANNLFTVTGSATNASITIDNIAPQVSITTAESSPSNANSITYSCAFSEVVSGLNNFTDFYFTGTTVATTDIAATTIVNSGDSQNYTLTLNNISGDGFLQFRLRRNQIADAAGNLLVISPTSLFDPFGPGLTIDNTAPVITLTGAASITQVVGEAWNDPGAGTDDGSAVQTGGDTVLTASPGTYTITYDSTDTAGNVATQVTRSVTIISNYDNWATTNGLTGNDALPDSDPEGDGVTNLEEFALDGDPNSETQKNNIETHLTTVSTMDHLALTLPVRSGAIFSGSPSPSTTIDGITYTIQGTLDLNDWTESLIEVTPADSTGLPSLSSGWEYRTFRFIQETSLNSNSYLRVQLTPVP